MTINDDKLTDPQIQKLINDLLDNKYAYLQDKAAKRLGELGVTEAIPHLIDVLRRNQGDQLEIVAAKQLGILQASEAVPYLIEALREAVYFKWEGLQFT